MRLATIALLAALSAVGTAAVAQQPDTAMTRRAMGDNTTDRTHGHDTISAEDFVKKAGQGSATEVAMGQLAMQKATNPQVRAFAQEMVADHTKANKQLMAAAKAKGIEVPDKPDMMHRAV